MSRPKRITRPQYKHGDPNRIFAVRMIEIIVQDYAENCKILANPKSSQRQKKAARKENADFKQYLLLPPSSNRPILEMISQILEMPTNRAVKGLMEFVIRMEEEAGIYTESKNKFAWFRNAFTRNDQESLF